MPLLPAAAHTHTYEPLAMSPYARANTNAALREDLLPPFSYNRALFDRVLVSLSLLSSSLSLSLAFSHSLSLPPALSLSLSRSLPLSVSEMSLPLSDLSFLSAFSL